MYNVPNQFRWAPVQRGGHQSFRVSHTHTHTHAPCTKPVWVSTGAKRFPHRYCYEFVGNGTRYVVGEGFRTHAFSWGRGTPEHEPNDVPKPQENVWVQEPPLLKQLSFHFLHSFSFLYGKKKSWEHGNIENWGSSPGINALGFFCWGRSLKIHTEIKK
jgi:hypothetical protein